MEKLLLTLLVLLLLVTGPAWAEWVRVSEADTAYVYINPETIREDGNLVKVWEVHDYKQRHKDDVLSRRFRVEYGCKEERFRFLSVSKNSGPMASGITLFTHDVPGNPDTWRQISPGTMSDRVLNIVCAMQP